MGDVMRLLQRHDEAKACLQEALQVMAPLVGSRNYEHVLGNLGQLTLDMGDFEAGMAWFSQFEKHVTVHHEPDLLIKAWRGQASALQHMGRYAEARLKAQAALDLAREHGNVEGQIQVLSLFALIPLEPGSAATDQAASGSAALNYLKQALEISSRIEGYSAAPELLNQTAAAYAANGDFRAAYETGLVANAARDKRHGAAAQKRALAMQIEREVTRVRSEAESHRQIAATLQETATTLKTLGIIGREITASLEAGAIFEALHRHVNNLLDATFFAVYLLDPAQQSLRTAFGVEAGVPLPVISTALNHPTSMFARCSRERQEIVIDREQGADDPNLIPGTLPSLSLIYSPLILGDRLLGAMSIQSPRPHVYGERERSIFRTLCAYGAIALDNARAYDAVAQAQRQAQQSLLELHQAQALLVAQNKQLELLAITDQLTGLCNRLQLDRTLAEERARHLRYGKIFSLLILDIDKFKAVNDSFGHPVGDQVLLGIARILQAGVREVDVVGRWGGEEFLVICRETALEGALLLAEKLRLAVECHVFDSVGSKSASIGVATFRPGESVIETINRADAALYQAKHAGRNRVVCGEPAPQ
jgi:diguanylate cyclase (GGDEF)-like protein